MGKVIGTVILLIPAVICFVLSCRQYQEKGTLLTIAYAFISSKKTKETDKEDKRN